MLLTEGQVSDYKGATAVLPVIPAAPVLIAKSRLRCRLVATGAARPRHSPVHPRQGQPLQADPPRKELYRDRHCIEIMFGRLTDWRRMHTCYDRCAHTLMSAIGLAATVLFWLAR